MLYMVSTVQTGVLGLRTCPNLFYNQLQLNYNCYIHISSLVFWTLSLFLCHLFSASCGSDYTCMNSLSDHMGHTTPRTD